MSNYNSDYSDSINPDNKVNIQKSNQGTPNYYGSAPQQSQPVHQPIQPFSTVHPQNLYPNPQQNSYGMPTGYPQPQYQYQQQYSPYPAQAVTNRFAVMALIFSLTGFIVGALTIVGIILGHRSLSEIKRTGEGGRGAATAALIIGYLQLGGWIVIIGFYVLFALATGASNSSY